MTSTTFLAMASAMALGFGLANNAAADDTQTTPAAPQTAASATTPAPAPASATTTTTAPAPATSAAAAAAPATPPSRPIALLKTIVPGTWNTSAELGAISTSGNTQGTSVTGKIDAKQELQAWSNEYIASGYYKEDDTLQADGSSERITSADRYALSAKAAYKLLQGGQTLFLLVSHVSDKFGAYTKYSSISVGHSAVWFKRPDKSLEVELGPGYFVGRLADNTLQQGVSVRAATTFKWQVSESALFTQAASVERGTSNTHSEIDTSLATKIYDKMQMKASFVARSDSNVPNQKKSTDTQTSLTLVYSF